LSSGTTIRQICPGAFDVVEPPGTFVLLDKMTSKFAFGFSPSPQSDRGEPNAKPVKRRGHDGTSRSRFAILFVAKESKGFSRNTVSLETVAEKKKPPRFSLSSRLRST